MAIPERIQAFLAEKGAEYEHVRHLTTYTARELAHEEHVPERQVAKSVVILGDEVFAMAVLPSDERIDVERMRKVLGLKELRLATEDELTWLFPDCEVGAMPPFGALYWLPVYIDKRLAAQERIDFNAGTHRDVLRMRYSELCRLVEPTEREFGEPVTQ
ncbi:MAG: YbaK/EbsC family protein [Bryobacterales bacterium]|nr:YbaK/EbsC family protein [Acidobacteriota bacterium]MCB9385990.1 YbaK/EbsC family protein [Bryobacterales bacterium]